MADFFNPGDVIINQLIIHGASSSIDCRSSLKTFSIYESILTPGILAEFVLVDVNDLNNMAPLLGNETITVDFSTPTRKNAVYNMIINSISGVMSGENLRHKMYTLKAASPHALDNAGNIVQKSYNTQISNMVKDIFDTFFTSVNKPLNIEETKGMQQFIVPNKKPLVAIDMLRRRSTSSLNLSGAFLFFEDQNSFNFKTMESLYQGDVGDRVFTQQSAKNYSMDRVSFRDIINLSYNAQFNTSDSLASGVVSSQVRQFDINTLQYTVKNIKINETDYNRAATGKTIPDEIASKFPNPGITFTLPVDSFNPPNLIAETTPHQAAMSKITGNIMATINVFGDTELTVGQSCQVNIYVKNSLTGDPELEPNVSGKYVISRLRHFVDKPEARPRYICCLDLIKGSLEQGA